MSPISVNTHKPSQLNLRAEPVVYWNQRLGLHQTDLTAVKEGEWLTDKHINAAQALLQAQFPSQQGLQDTLSLEQCGTYTAGIENFVQIVYINGNHWVCVANKFSPKGTIDVYDCAPSLSKNSMTLRKQLAVILKCQSSSFVVRHVEVQRQTGCADCGLFSIAFAYSLCCGLDPHAMHFKQLQMRPHYECCIDAEKITMFPTSLRNRRQAAKARCLYSKKVCVFCKCRLPWDRDDIVKGPMIQCHRCKEWYHKKCCRIDINLYNKGTKYICLKCKTAPVQ